jgi:hypothetical protein
LRDKRTHFVLTAHIGAHEFGRGAKGMQFPRQLQACIVMATRDNEVAAFACKGQRGDPSDSGQRTSDQDDLSAHVETPPKRETAALSGRLSRPTTPAISFNRASVNWSGRARIVLSDHRMILAVIRSAHGK